MKKIVSILFCLIVMLLSISVNASAATAPLSPGRVNADDSIDVKDATEVQKYLAGLCGFSKDQEFCADVDDDGKVTIKDATTIQKFVADIIPEFNKEPGYIHIHLDAFYANFESSMAMAGVPVTFTANAKGYLPPFSYDFLVNDVVVAENSRNNSFTYTFEEAGTYFITVRATNSFSVVSELTTMYEVVDPYESEAPVITALYYDKNYFLGEYNEINAFDTNITITAEAVMGSGNYEYCFLINDEVVQDFSENNHYLMENAEDRATYKITVYVRNSGTYENYVSKTITVESGFVM